VFLIGDAAHRVTPRGGTGMNTAIYDGYDVGWKLSWVLCGWAEPSLLESYENERRPVAEYNVRRSADPNGSFRDAQQELHADLGGRIPHLWLPSENGQVSTHDLLGMGLTLFIGSRAATWKKAAASVQVELPLQIHSLDVITAHAMGIRADGALLARPDGWPVATWAGGVDASAGLPAAINSVSRQAFARVERHVA
jgi:putative polyketide hydroxylase